VAETLQESAVERKMNAKTFLQLFLLAATVTASAAAQEVDGYGPWRFGMSKAQVLAIEQFAPYTPVASTEGLETQKGPFMGETRNVSFAFGLGGLSHIQIWVYEGKSYEEAIQQFHHAYQHLVENFGPVHQDGNPWPADLTAETLASRIPPEYQESGSPEKLMEELKSKGSAKVDTLKLHLHPQKPVKGADVYASFLHSPRLGFYWVFLYYKLPERPVRQVQAG
jgi:hypothetical protein